MHPIRVGKRGSLAYSVLAGACLVGALAGLAFLATSCDCFRTCHVTAHIRANQGAEGLVPGTVRVKAGERICWKNEDTVAHTVTFTNSPGKHPAEPQSITIAPGQTVKMKVPGGKPTGGYGLSIVPPASTTGSWPPGEPEVIVE